MIRSFFLCVLMIGAAWGSLWAQQDRVIRISFTSGNDTYYLSFEDGGGGELVTQKMAVPGEDESFFLQSFGTHTLGGQLYIITSLEGDIIRVDEDKQLMADQKEVCSSCLFRVTGQETVTIYDLDGWMLAFSAEEEAFMMRKAGEEMGKTEAERLAEGLSLQGYDIPGGIEGIDVFRTVPGLEELKIQFPELWEDVTPPFDPLKLPWQSQPPTLPPFELPEDVLKKNNPVNLKKNLRNE